METVSIFQAETDTNDENTQVAGENILKTDFGLVRKNGEIWH